ncbi:MAG: hypothetical protein R3Y10_10945 [Ferrimonas sp.]
MKKRNTKVWLSLIAALGSGGILESAATEYGGTPYYQLVEQAQRAKPRQQILARADSLAELRQQLSATQVEANGDPLELNQLLQSAPTAAGQAARKVIQKQVADKCYSSWQANACSRKTVYLLVR